MNKKTVILLIFACLATPVFAKELNLEMLKEKARQYQQEGGKGGEKLNEAISTEPPTSRFVDSSARKLSDEDNRHILVHMKLANRNFSKKNYDKAIEEANSVLERDPSHAGGHFMLAVINARKKNYLDAWYHISAAKALDSSNSKIDDFITKLVTVSQKPDQNKWVDGIYTGMEVSACDRVFDILEFLLKNEVSQNVTSIEFADFSESGSETSVECTFKALSEFSSQAIEDVLKKAALGKIKSIESQNNLLKVSMNFSELKSENSEARPVSNLNDFIADLTEQMPEIAISNTEEADLPGGKEVIYNISTREFPTLNSFMRKISPFAKRYQLQKMNLAYVPGTQNTMWKAVIKVLYK